MKKTIGISGSNGLIGSELMKIFGNKAKSIPRQDLPFLHTEWKYDTIIHCAAYGNHSQQTDLQETFYANVYNTFCLLESAKRCGVKNFIFIGSSSEYGKKTEPMKEDMTLDCDTMYSCTKVAGTYLTKHYSKYFNTITIRPFSVYGEQEANWRFIPTIINRIQNNESIDLFEGTHDWIFNQDFCEGVKVCLDNIKNLNGQTINIGSGESFNNQFIVKALFNIAKKKVPIEEYLAKVQDSSVWVANIDKIKSLGWKPKTDILSGLKKVYDFKTNESKAKENINK